jgi:cytochrome P450
MTRTRCGAVVLTSSSARDERKYARPDLLDIHRTVDLHVTFGYGIHFCLGAALARMEGRIGLEETLARCTPEPGGATSRLLP